MLRFLPSESRPCVGRIESGHSRGIRQKEPPMRRHVLTSVPLIMLIALLSVAPRRAKAQGDSDAEAKFIAMLRNATLKGTWAPVQKGKLGGERGDDSYRIA